MDNFPVMYSPDEHGLIEKWQEGDGTIVSIAHEVKSEYIHSDVYIIDEGNGLRFATVGMGARQMNAPPGFPNSIELFLMTTKNLIKNQVQRLILDVANQLVRISKMPWEEDSWIGRYHTIDANDKIKELFGYGGFIVVPTNQSKLLDCGDEIHLFQLVPIYQSEMESLWQIAEGESVIEKYETFVLKCQTSYTENNYPFGVIDFKRTSFFEKQ